MQATSYSPEEVEALLPYLTPQERSELDALMEGAPVWLPLPGPQVAAYESDADEVGYGGAAGGGKGLALDTPLPTPEGWVCMGDVREGDQLFDERGQPCTVVAVSEMACRPCYRMVFDDGSEIVCDDVHRWVTFDETERAALTRRDPKWKAQRRAKRQSRAKGNKSAAFSAALAARNTARAAAADVLPAPTGAMRDTAEIARTLLTRGDRTNHAIRVAGALETGHATLPVAPYTLGAWLGDGTRRNGQFTGVDPGIWQRIEADGYEVRHYTWDEKQHNIIGLKCRLRDLGVLENKHIPPRYLRASFSQRLALLQGLMDTDGHAALDGGCEFDGVREALVDGVLELVHSLGIKATKQKGTAKLNGRVTGSKYRVKFTTTLPVFGLPRKANRLREKTRSSVALRYIVACEPVPTVPTRCLAVDSPSRQYLASAAMVPTHNTDLIAGLVLTKHKRALIVRREKAQTEGVVQRLTEILKGTDGYNSQKGFWRLPGGRLCEFAGLDNPGDEQRWQGRPHDLKAFDEVTEMREAQVRFVMGWNRTSDPTIRAKTVMTFNPPTRPEGRWVLDFFGPWLLETHPLYPTPPGVLRWVTMLPGADGNSQDTWLDDGRPFVLEGGERVYDFDPARYTPEQVIQPKTRTFIPARVTDNTYYMRSGYLATLQMLPEPLRSQMLYGNFQAGMEDDPFQVLPTDWVKAAMARWKRPGKLARMDALGIDVALGGRDNTVIARRHGMWFDEPLVHPGNTCTDGPTVAGFCVAAARNGAVMHLDLFGVGARPYGHLMASNQPVRGINVGDPATSTDETGKMRFYNLRSQLWWAMREALDPAANTGIALPNDQRLLADLCAATWCMQGAKIKVASREEMVAKLGRSPDFASAYVLGLMDTPRRSDLQALAGERKRRVYDPYANLKA